MSFWPAGNQWRSSECPLLELMEQHGLKQGDLADCAPHSRISDLRTGKRKISKDVAKKLAARFNVRADLFL